MRIEESTTEVMNEWRSVIKSKRRMIYTFDERAQIRLDAIRRQIHKTRLVVDEWQIRECYFRDLSYYEYTDPDWRTIRIGEQWGGTDVTAFFKRRIEIPHAFTGETVMLRFYIGGDSLLSLNGVPYHGLDPFRNEVLLTQCAQGGEVLDIDIEAYVNWHTGEADNKRFHQAELVTVDKEILEAYWDFWAAFKVLAIEDLSPELRGYLETCLWDALKLVPPYVHDLAEFKAKLLTAQERLHRTVYASDRFKVGGLLHLVGHSHLDIVFMWPYREYVRKIGRTHATMLRLMEQYPEFQFCQSMAKTYADMKAYFPAIYEQVKERITEGRWEVIGAFWVEPDCNLISGESYVRQILYGQRFFQKEFGLRSQTCWQPDVFGMSAAMPQILGRSGIRYVMTTKMFVWNDTNPWDKNTFWWEGIDGSQVLTVVTPSHFIGMVDPDHMHTHWRDFSDKETIGESIYCYGWGDGGGGVDVEMLESARRYKDLMGLPRAKLSGAEEALRSIEAKAEATDIAVWRDELYLEAHRGTFTNKAQLKKLNRQGELLYREAELLATLAWQRGALYPAQQLDEGWLIFLTTQFHDSVPGTHVTEVLGDLLAEHEQAARLAKRIRAEAFAALVPSVQEDPPRSLVVFNSFLHPRSDVLITPTADLGDGIVAVKDGEPLTHQYVTGLDGEDYYIAHLPEIPPVGYRVFELAASETRPRSDDSSSIHTADNVLENDLIKAIFNQDGELVSLWDKEHAREVIVRGQVGNRFQLFEDMPGKYDAWDIVATYEDHEIDVLGGGRLEVEESGPVRVSLRLEKPFRDSYITQRISLYAGSRQLVFETHVDWAERQKLLKVSFPVEINATFATYDIAFGNLKRPTHRNTSYDAAKFEVPAHQWMDISQHDYGVSLLNDCKYGHEANGKLMRLTLLKGSIYPDEYADLGEHCFTYVLYPHVGSWEHAGTIQHALNLNQPLLARVSNAGIGSQHSFMSCTAPNVTLEALKRSEDGTGTIVRLVEQHNSLTKATLYFDHPIRAAWTCNLMEECEEQLQAAGQELMVTLRPYEILTLKVVH